MRMRVKRSKIEFLRLQFPLKLAYAITIQRAQGLTLEKVLLHLYAHLFAHGQLHVALSRVRKRDNIKVCARQSLQTTAGTFTRNVVFREFVEASGLYRHPEASGNYLISVCEGNVNISLGISIYFPGLQLKSLGRIPTQYPSLSSGAW